MASHSENLDTHRFADRVGIELNRAERYRIFVSLTVIELAPLLEKLGERASAVKSRLEAKARESVRTCDYVAFIHESCLAFLFPETPRQGAEIATRRLTDLIKDEVSRMTGEPLTDMVAVEIASYPDTAGARTMSAFLEELAQKHRN